MAKRWGILAALALSRGSMSLQFHAIPALGATLAADGMSYAAIGALTGVYLLPGAAAALGGGWLGQRFGDIRTALFGLAAMTLFGALGALAESYEAQMAARFLAGLGAVALNVMMNKMAADWFQSTGELPTAMAILSSSWPTGLGLAALILPALAVGLDLQTALLAPAAVCAAAFALMAALWRAPEGAPPPATGRRGLLTGRELGMALVAGAIWGLYNVGFVAPVAWGPDALSAAGVAPVAAAAAVSLVGWTAIFSIIGGGWLSARAARAGWRDAVPLTCFALSAAALAAFALLGAAAAHPAFQIGVGLVMGPAAGMILTLPVEVARAEVRALSVGVFLATYYLTMSIGQPLLGALRDALADPGAPLIASGGCFAACIALWLGLQAWRAAAPAAS
jgi:MFS family permease